jgi:thioester reductase-like protein
VATVRASCPTCGDIELTTRQVQVDLCETTRDTTYSFQCPACSVRVSKPASEKVVGVLTDAGVRVQTWRLPAVGSDDRSGPPVSYDELLAFHFQLNDDDVVARLLSTVY